jgi:Ca2+-binding EF-hand superfamily protein
MATQERQEFSDLREIIRHMDVDHNGKLAYNEFISACLSKATANSLEYLSFAFKHFDLNHDGKISKEELAIILRAYKREFSENLLLIDKLLQECDINNDGQIDFEEFVGYMQKNSV